MLLWQPGGEKGAKIQGCIFLAWRQPALLVPAQLPPAASFPPSQCWDFLWAPLLGTFAYTPLPKARQSPSNGGGLPACRPSVCRKEVSWVTFSSVQGRNELQVGSKGKTHLWEPTSACSANKVSVVCRLGGFQPGCAP